MKIYANKSAQSSPQPRFYWASRNFGGVWTLGVLAFLGVAPAATVNPETSYIPLGDRFAAQIALSLVLLEEITQDASPAKALRPVARASPRLFRSKTVLSIWKTSSWILMLYQKHQQFTSIICWFISLEWLVYLTQSSREAKTGNRERIPCIPWLKSALPSPH